MKNSNKERGEREVGRENGILKYPMRTEVKKERN